MNKEMNNYYDLIKEIVEDTKMDILNTRMLASVILILLIIILIMTLLYYLIKLKSTSRYGKLDNIKDAMHIYEVLTKKQEDLDDQYDKLGNEIEKLPMVKKEVINQTIEDMHRQINDFISAYQLFLIECTSYMNYGFRNKYMVLLLEQQVLGILFLYNGFYENYCKNFHDENLNIVFKYNNIRILYRFINRRFYKVIYNYFHYKNLFKLKKNIS